MRVRYVLVGLAVSVLSVITAAAAAAAPAQHGRAHGHDTAASLTRRTAAASAMAIAPQSAHPGSCSGSGSRRVCAIPTQDVWSAQEFNPIIFRRSDGIPILVVPGSLVDITCWYYGNPPSGYAGDGILDHAVSPVVGHIPDPYVNEGNENPWQSPYDLPECG
jgi:hypothetical protein